MRCASFTRGLVSVTLSNGASQPSISFRSSGYRRSQISTTLGARIRQRAVPESRPHRRSRCRAWPATVEHFVDGRQHVRAGAERVLESRGDEIERRRRAGALEMRGASRRTAAAPRPETKRSTASRRRRRKCVRVDRARPAPAKNSRDQEPDDLPLLRAGVLRLVDQHMVDAEIELVVHPGGIDAAESEASCRSGRHSRAGRGGPSRPVARRAPHPRW